MISGLMISGLTNVRFAEIPSQCDNSCMQKFSTAAIHLLATGMLLGNALAQQTPAATTPPTSPAPATSPKAQTPAGTAHSATAAKKTTAAPLVLKTQKDKFSYALGMNTAKRMSEGLKKQSVPFDSAIFVRGLRDGFAGGKTLLTEEEAQAVMTEMQKQMHEQQQAKMQQAAEGNKKEGDAFLAANKGKEGVVTLPSGLQYKIVTAGTGPKPTTSDSVVCNYRGTLINGTEFDSSYKRGQPATFPVTGVIKGWTEALQLMRVGSKWQLFIPADLAYGDRGAGSDIGPGSTLIFEIELLSIADKSKDKTPGTGDEKK
jgi:FKBP-type peptidyl-prolyl cis-trans isomerase FklB